MTSPSSAFEDRRSLFLELGFRKDGLELLKKYIDLLWQSNDELNLISRKMTFEELVDNHVIDCMLAIPHFPTGLKAVADFGSGGGLPAVLLAIQFPETKFYLYEKSPKKREYLQKCQRLVPNIQVQSEITPQLPPDVKLVTARAFKPLDVILEISREYFKSGGSYFLLKGRLEKVDEEILLAKKKFKDLNSEILKLRSPVLDVERHILRIK